MSSRKKEIPRHDPEKDQLEFLCPSASAGEMTGLIPAGGADENDRSAYQELFPFLADKQEKRDS